MTHIDSFLPTCEETEMTKCLQRFAGLALILLPFVAHAQTMEKPRPWEVGDKMTHLYVTTDGSRHDVVEEVVQVTATEIVTTQKFFAQKYSGTLWREFEGRYSTADIARTKGFCWSNNEQCEFSPGIPWVRFPLEKGRTWKSSVASTGQTFVAGVKSDRTVDGVEQITTPAGEFTAFKVTSRGEITVRSKDLTQGPWEGRERYTCWFTTIKGKLALVRLVYENSFGEKTSLELIGAEVK
jgi:hypothetical protein